ncbi:MAG: hypothetical protein SVV03_00240 [Candidatus Nanohaloarchaea archaeon]|nr:hypothetical protein [Candidatus Nanohaloarchaea archaeon]
MLKPPEDIVELEGKLEDEVPDLEKDVDRYFEGVKEGIAGLKESWASRLALTLPISPLFFAYGCVAPIFLLPNTDNSREKMEQERSREAHVKDIRKEISKYNPTYANGDPTEELKHTSRVLSSSEILSPDPEVGKKITIPVSYDERFRPGDDKHGEKLSKEQLEDMNELLDLLDKQENVNRIAEIINADNQEGEVKMYGIKKNGERGWYTIEADNTEVLFKILPEGEEPSIIPVEPRKEEGNKSAYPTQHLYEDALYAVHTHNPRPDVAGPSEKDLKGKPISTVTPITYPGEDKYIGFNLDITAGDNSIDGKDITDTGDRYSEVEWRNIEKLPRDKKKN